MKTSSERKRAGGTRRWRLAAILGGLVLLALGSAVMQRNALLEHFLLRALHAEGIEPASLTVTAFEIDHVSIDSLRVGDGELQLENLTARYSLGSLTRRRLESLELTGLQIRGELGDAGVQIGVLDTLLPGAGGSETSAGSFPVLPTERLEIEAARLVLDTAEGEFVAALDLDLDAAGVGTLSVTTTPLHALATSAGIEVDAFAASGAVAFGAERAELNLASAPFRLSIAGETASAAPLELRGTTPAVVLSANAAGAQTAELTLAGGELHLPESGFSIRGIEAKLGVHPAALFPIGTLALQEIRDEREEPAFPPLTFEAEIRPNGDVVVLEGSLLGLNERLKIDVSGSHDPASGAGQASLLLRELRFAADALRPRDVLPNLAASDPTADGAVVASGEFRWGEPGLQGFIDLGLRDLTLQSGGATVERVNAALRIDEPWLPRMRRGQIISMARIDAGLELTNGLVTYELRPDGVIAIESAAWEFAGGTLHTKGAIDLAASEQTLTLDVAGVDLEQLLKLVNLEGLSGTGTLNGSLPVVRRGDEIQIVDAILETSSEGGQLRYAPEARAAVVASAAGSALDDLLVALEDFHYETLRLTVNGDALGEVTVALSLHGSNPSHRDSQPYEFNLTVDGALTDLVRQSGAAYQIPATIEKRINAIANGE